MSFAESIKAIRKSKYLSQESFAKEIGVSFSTVNRWENGKSKPNYAAMKQITAFCERNSLHVPLADIAEKNNEEKYVWLR